MRFTKMHGAGNDYVYVDCFREELPSDLPQLAQQISDRHKGVGADGLILIRPSDVADARMQMLNADGSEAEMCGNGVRCVAKYVYDHGICQRDELKIETGAGVLSLSVEADGGLVQRVRVDMGVPVLNGLQVPTTWDLPQVVDQPLEIAGQTLGVTCVSMGNPHCITYVDELNDHWVLSVGPQVETDSHFPRRVNAEFVQVLSPSEVRLRVWERGSGETQACGTGASAVCVAGVLTGRTERKIVAHLPGGDLELEWSEAGRVYMTGPAAEVFTGEWNMPRVLAAK